jgi:hypothetical protein
MFGKPKYSRAAFEEAQDREKNAETIAANEKEVLLEEARNARHNALKTSEHAGGGFLGDIRAYVQTGDAAKHAARNERRAEQITPEGVRKEARQRLKGLMTSGHAEALKLNEKYDKLIARAELSAKEANEAEEQVRTFEREELGM